LDRVDRKQEAETMWRSVFEEPEKWRDYREAKESGKCKPRHPDFKQQAFGGTALWLDDHLTPGWVKACFREEDKAARPVQKTGSSGGSPASAAPSEAAQRRACWESLCSERERWRDRRPEKEAGTLEWREADFENRRTGAKLWLSDPDIPQSVCDMLKNTPKDDPEANGALSMADDEGDQPATTDELVQHWEMHMRERRQARQSHAAN